MKKLIISTALFAVIGLTTYAQNGTGFGIKGGLNYNANGDYFDSSNQITKHPDRNIGYHLGFFGKFGDKIYFRPELVYTSTKSDYNSDTFKMNKLDAPMLIGLRFFHLFNVFGGPSFQYILNTDFNDINIDNIENDFTVGLNFGIGVEINKVGIDLRYERGFNSNEATFIDNNLGGTVSSSRLDTRPDQLILSLSVKL
jgi:hypothetical protein